MTTHHGDATDFRQAAWSGSDTALVLRLAVSFPLAWAAGEDGWERWALALERRPRLRRAPGAGGLAARLATILAKDRADPDLVRLADACSAARTIRQLQFLRCHRPDGWNPSTRLHGREHADTALSYGRGAILWVTPTAYASLLTKLTLHRAGLPLCHLSRWYHGASRSRWGVRLLNPLQRRAEDRFLAERVIIGARQSPLPATRRLRRRLHENRLVSISVGRESTGAVSLPFLFGSIALAAGPIKLAAATGAPLLPTVTFRDPAGVFTTTIEPPLTVPSDAHGSPAVPLRDLARRLEHQALLHPAQFFWPGGLLFLLRGESAGQAPGEAAAHAPPILPAFLDTTI
jgi:hypothetical protein